MPDSANRTEVIAEAGVNHNGSIDMALRLVDAAAEAGADTVKFQTFRADALVTASAPLAAYQAETVGDAGTQAAMLRALELDLAAHLHLAARARERGIGFLSTPFDHASLDLLIAGVRVDRIKLGSSELTNAPLLIATARSGRPVLLSTGMGTQAEVQAALGALAYGYLDPASAPGPEAFERAYAASRGQRALAEKVTLMQCTTAYPTPPEDANLRAIPAMREAFGLPVGFSDHTLGTVAAIAAVALGATVVEKHLTLDRALPGPDHRASLDPVGFAELVAAVRSAEVMLGDGVKAPRPSERANMAAARKSLVAARQIPADALLAAGDLAVKRPGTGLSPFRYWDRLGTPARRAYAPDEVLE